MTKSRRGRASESIGDDEWIYLVRGGGYVKIGVSTDVSRRLRALRTSSPFALELVAKVPGGYTLERELHSRFASFRSHGEWFLEHESILQFFAEFWRRP